MDPEKVLSFWFDGDDSRWWKKDPDFDATIQERFGAWVAAASRGELQGWRDQPRSCLALIVLLDQFTRNTRRGSGTAWADDPQALAAAEGALAAGHDQQVGHRERQFFYMPLMHAEDLARQERCVALFQAYVEAAPDDRRAGAENNLRFAVAHRDIIARFGRFPHRNTLLGRTSTPEEDAFLQQPGSSF